MNIQVTFDKEYYLPGETMNAEVAIQDRNNEVRKVRINLYGRETVRFKIRSGKHSYTAMEEIDLYANSITIQPVEGQNIYRGKISVIIPLDVAGSYHSENVNVFHGIEVELDQKWKPDQRYYYPTDVRNLYNNKITPIKTETKFVTFELPQNVYSSGDLVKYRFILNLFEGFRALRLDLFRFILGQARGEGYMNTERISTQSVDLEFQKPFLLPKRIKTIRGINFQIDYFFKFVVDRALKKDYTLQIPIIIQDRVERFCPSCGAQITGDLYCTVCGNKI